MKERGSWKPIRLLVMGIALGLFCFFYADPPISQLCLGLSPHLRYPIKVASRFLSPPFHLALWASIYLIFRERKKKNTFFFLSRKILYSLLISLPLIYGMKILLGRARPELLSDTIYGFYFMMHNHHYHSFPSGHAAVATSVFMPLMHTFPKYRVGCIILFLLLSSSRVLLNYHYASDIVASAVICFLVQESYKKYRDRDQKKRKSDLYNPIS